MGFNCLWLMPWMAGPTYHKYGATDFCAVDPDFGSEQELRDLIDDAHQRGMRVLVDFVGNHCSDQHPFFLEALANPTSRYRKWFYFTEDGNYHSFFGGGELPHLCHDNPETRRYIIDLARHWVREYGIDGYDLDYAVGPALEFWADFGQAVRQVSDSVAIFTEGVTTPEALLTFQGRVDGCQDFAWCQAARRTFASGKLNVEEFERFMAGSDAFFPKNFIAPIMIDNQNMNRFLLVAGNDQRRLCVAAACQYSISQPISVWAGTEMGMTQAFDITGKDLNYIRYATAWDDMNEETVAWFRKLGALRAEHMSLRRGVRIPLIADAETGVLAYEKKVEADRCVVVFNTSEVEREVSLPQLAGCHDVLGNHRVVPSEDGGTVILSGWSAAYLVPNASSS
jgi:glycosidase